MEIYSRSQPFQIWWDCHKLMLYIPSQINQQYVCPVIARLPFFLDFRFTSSHPAGINVLSVCVCVCVCMRARVHGWVCV